MTEQVIITNDRKAWAKQRISYKAANGMYIELEAGLTEIVTDPDADLVAIENELTARLRSDLYEQLKQQIELIDGEAAAGLMPGVNNYQSPTGPQIAPPPSGGNPPAGPSTQTTQTGDQGLVRFPISAKTPNVQYQIAATGYRFKGDWLELVFIDPAKGWVKAAAIHKNADTKEWRLGAGNVMQKIGLDPKTQWDGVIAERMLPNGPVIVTVAHGGVKDESKGYVWQNITAIRPQGAQDAPAGQAADEPF